MTSETASHADRVEDLTTEMGVALCERWRLTVGFWRRDDRYLHRIAVVQDLAPGNSAPENSVPASGQAILTLAETLAEQENSAWPLNPPLQQLDECELSGQRRGIIGLGMAGTSHWSMAVEAIDGKLWFDVACRIQKTPEMLQSSYSLTKPCQLLERRSAGGGPCVALAGGPDGIPISLEADPECTELVVESDGRCVHVRPKQIPDDLPSTVRWRFGFGATA